VDELAKRIKIKLTGSKANMNSQIRRLQRQLERDVKKELDKTIKKYFR
jgi:hypothetical protein